MSARRKGELSEAELSRWRLIEQFEQRLERAAAGREEPRSFRDRRRKLGQKDYFSLLLFGLFNPVVDSMRGLCAASRLRRVQEEICSAKVSLGSFSETQAVVDPELLQRVFGELAAELQSTKDQGHDQRLEPYRGQLLVVDGTLWRALPRMIAPSVLPCADIATRSETDDAGSISPVVGRIVLSRDAVLMLTDWPIPPTSNALELSRPAPVQYGRALDDAPVQSLVLRL